MTDGTVLADRYELGDVLGRGGMADVHRAHDRTLGRAVAVKVLRETASEERDRARFASEARTLARLSHSGLVTVLDAGITAERPFLVMELVEGPTLARVVSSGPLGVEEVGAIGVQLAEALAYAHASGVVHRDVKPGNVLLATGRRVKLADFGIARLLGDTVRHTQTGTALGTAAYLAPEQVRGDEVSGATDVYSLGLVLLEALTGERAYPGQPTEAALARLHRAPVVPPHLPEAWRHLLTAMTALDPAERPTPAEVATTLRGQPTGTIPAVTSVPVDAPDPSGDTVLMSQAPPTVVSAATGAPAEPSAIDRAGDRISQTAVDWGQRSWEQVMRNPGLSAALAAIVLLLVIVALAS